MSAPCTFLRCRRRLVANVNSLLQTLQTNIFKILSISFHKYVYSLRSLEETDERIRRAAFYSLRQGAVCVRQRRHFHRRAVARQRRVCVRNHYDQVARRVRSVHQREHRRAKRLLQHFEKTRVVFTVALGVRAGSNGKHRSTFIYILTTEGCGAREGSV